MNPFYDCSVKSANRPSQLADRSPADGPSNESALIRRKRPLDTERETPRRFLARSGKIRYGLAAWLIGLPIPIIILAVLFRGCDW